MRQEKLTVVESCYKLQLVGECAESNELIAECKLTVKFRQTQTLQSSFSTSTPSHVDNEGLQTVESF